jgi:internalin A
MRSTLFILSILAASSSFVSPLYAEDPVYFPDARLKAAVEAALGVTDPTPTEMLGLTTLDADQQEIEGLTGLEYAVNLTWLSLSENQISDVSPLAGLTNLAMLNLYGNLISDIAVLSGLTNLTELHVGHNQISDVSPLAGLTNLTRLFLGENQISDIGSLVGLTKLTVLYLGAGGNQISDIAALSGMTNLTDLYLGENQISDISPLAGLTNLTLLCLGGNQVSDVSPLAGLTNLTRLYLWENQISDISALSGMTNLTELLLGENQIGDISPLGGLTNIAILHLYGNQISDISPLSGLTNLDLLDLTNNPLNSDAYSDYIPMIQANNPVIELLCDPYSPPVHFADANLKAAVEVALGVTDPTPTEMLGLTTLHADQQEIEGLTGLEYAVNLTWLSLSENQISDVSPLAGMANLAYLDLRWNRISDILALSDLTNLTMLLLDGNQISDIGPLSGLTKLDRLSLWDNQISDLSPVGALADLTMLELCDNQVNNISPLAGLTKLTFLSLSENQISDISPISGLTNLTDLGLCRNQVSDISPLAGLTNLTFLHLGINQVSDVSPLSGLINLTDLYVGNQVTDISPLAGLTNLTLLDLGDNQVSDISPLAALTNLTELHLWGNQISDLSALAELRNLEDLLLNENQISDLSWLAQFTKLEQFGVDSNPLDNDAYCLYLPQIKANNPLGDGLTYSPNSNPPSGVQASDGLHADRVRITWEAKCNGPNYSTTFYYRVYRGTSVLPGRGAVALGSWQTGTSFDDTSALPATTYYYWVKSAMDTGGSDETAYSEVDAGFLAGPTLDVSSTAGGRVTSPGEGTFHYPAGTTVPLAAAADPNFHFVAWTGTAVDANKVADANALETTVVVDSNHTLVANFESELDTLYVGSSGDPNGDGTQDHPLGQVQDAIAVAAEGSRLVIGSGTYTGPLDLQGKAIELTGLDPNDPNQSSWPVIDAQGAGSVLSFTHGEGADTIVRGLVLTGGKGDKAGAIYCPGSSPTIVNCLIVGNRATDPNSGAVYCQSSNAAIINCTIADNCSGPNGAGVYLVDSPVVLSSSILWGNSPAQMTVAQGSAPTVAYSDIAGGWSGTGNIALDPLFALPGWWTDLADPNAFWTPGDYHLLSTAGRWDPATTTWVEDTMTSPCVDAGDAAIPIDDEPEPNGGRINIGAYGGTAQASKSP